MNLFEPQNLVLDNLSDRKISSSWSSPSNIALVKYWGKFPDQKPKNPSISLTLSVAQTHMSVEAKEKKISKGVEFDFLFEDREMPSFHPKLKQSLERWLPYLPMLENIRLSINSRNTFPHAAGIASSASAMSALACCVLDIENQLGGSATSNQDFKKKASFLARLGSGSACRSLFEVASVWGKTGALPSASDDFGIEVKDEIHEVFHDFHDDILIVSKDEKSVSSTAGHKLMDRNVYASTRYESASKNLVILLEAMKVGDLETFGEITESEALVLHALMMASTPSYILMEPNSLEIIKRIRAYRKESKEPVYFTLDAGPNIHVLYPESRKEQIQLFIKNELQSLCFENRIIQDRVGLGSQKL